MTRRPSNVYVIPPGRTPADTAGLLTRAADIVQFGGWTQGTSARDSDGEAVSPIDTRAVAWCVAGAMRVALGMFWVDGSAEYALLDFIRRDSWWDSIAQWNDAPSRTAGEVADTLRRCAKECCG